MKLVKFIFRLLSVGGDDDDNYDDDDDDEDERKNTLENSPLRSSLA